jgi:hypothetical protein
MNKERMQILKMVEDGQISTDEAMQLLNALSGAEPPDEPMIEEMETAAQPEEQAPSSSNIPDVGNMWLYPTIAGAVVMAVGAPLMALGLTGQAALFWAIFCGWIPFFIGLAILTLGVWSRNARWFHLRISNAHSGERTFALSLPLPLTLAAWSLKIARPYVPQLKETGVDEAILALRDGLGAEGKDQPFHIDVQDDEDGEHIQIYIG